MIIRDPDKVDLCDMIITVIWRVDKELVPDKIHGRIIYHQGEYDKPISLADIQRKYPKVSMVIAEYGLEGKVYRYGNNKDENGKPLWEEVGKTQGYA
jgi:hypothetical protein